MSELKPEQSDIADWCIQGGDALAVLPTGFGKSRIYQHVTRELGGMTIVISPLIALMEDQVRAARDYGLRAVAVHSQLGPAERQLVREEIRSGRTDLLLVTPERLQSEDFRGWLARQAVKLLAVDEAHCVSLWGHDWRESYQQIGHHIHDVELRRGKPITKLAVTATATSEVQADIIKSLRLREPKLLVRSPNRANVQLSVLRPQDKNQQLLALVRLHLDAPVLIYCSSVAATNRLAQWLCTLDIPAVSYNGRMSAERRRDSHAAFTGNDAAVMVATTAFGMGVDKADIRTIIHYDLPDSLERYIQEVGRAGRDGEPAFAYLLYHESDREIPEAFIEQTTPQPEDVADLWSVLISLYGFNTPSAIDVDLIGRAHPRLLTPRKVHGMIEVLRRAGSLETAGDEQGGVIISCNEVSSAFDEKLLRHRRSLAWKRLEQMVAYARTTLCKRHYMLRHFGFREDDYCGNCSTCLMHAEDKASHLRLPVEAVRRIMAGLCAVSGSIDRASLQDHLSGRAGISGLLESSYGILRDRPYPESASAIENLVREGLLTDLNGSLSVTSLGAEWAKSSPGKGVRPITGAVSIQAQEISSERREVLEAIRRRIALARHIPVYEVWPDEITDVIGQHQPEAITEEWLYGLGLTEGDAGGIAEILKAALALASRPKAQETY